MPRWMRKDVPAICTLLFMYACGGLLIWAGSVITDMSPLGWLVSILLGLIGGSLIMVGTLMYIREH